MNKLFALAGFFSLCLVACDGDELEEVVWMSDRSNPALPAYSEWGYNTYGALVNGNPFVSPHTGDSWWERNFDAAMVSSRNDSLIISFRGGFSFGSEDAVEEMSFRFPFESISSFTGLGSLDGVSLDLASNDCNVSLVVGSGSSRKGVSQEIPVDVSHGRLHFQRVQIVYVDERCREAVLSGSFEFKASHGKAQYDVTDGRFDIGVDDDNLDVE